MTKKIENTSKTLKNCQKNRKIQTEKNTSLKKKVWMETKIVVLTRSRDDKFS
jgi:hypothetical protein